MARKRLNEVIGPLRMQLLFSARDFIRRARGHAGRRWNMDPSDHFARSFIHRLLRPLAVSQLIERQMSVADFSVDPAAVALLRFNTASERMLSGDDIVLQHPATDWSTQSQHLFRDNLRVAAARLILDEENGPIILDYARFQREIPDLEADVALRDLARIFSRCQNNLTENPLLWLRIVGYAQVCHRLIATHGVAVGFEDVALEVNEMLRAVDDELISTRASDYVRAFETVIAQGL